MLSPVKKPGANPVRTVLEQTLGWLPPESESSYLVNTADRTLSPAGCHPVPGYFTTMVNEFHMSCWAIRLMVDRLIVI